MRTADTLLLCILGAILIAFLYSYIYWSIHASPVGDVDGRAPEKWTPLAPIRRQREWLFGAHHAVHFGSVDEAFYHRPNPWVLDLIFILVGVAFFIYMNVDLNVSEQLTTFPKWDSVSYTLNGVFHPDWDFFWGLGFYRFNESVVYEIFQTFGIAFVSTLAASVLALPFGLLASHKLFGKYAWFSEIFLILIRTFPELLLAIMMVAFSGINAVTGIVALAFHSIGMIGKLYAEQIDEINMEPLEALSAAGATSWQKVHLGVIPQIRASLYSVALYRFDINIRTATILGVVVGADCGIGYSISVNLDAQKWNLLGSCIFGVVILIIIIDLFSAWLRKKLV